MKYIIKRGPSIVDMQEKKLQLEKLLQELFETGIVPDSKRNRFLVNVIIFCITTIANFIKRDDDNLHLL